MPTVFEQQEVGYKFDEVEHIHSLDGLPLHGTTTVLGVISKPLTWWASGMACAEFGWINPKPYNKPKPTKEDVLAAARPVLEAIKTMDIDAYLAKLDKAYRAHNVKLDKSADEGVDLHSMIEAYVQSQLTGIPQLFDEEKIKPFIEWSKKNVKRFLWAEACHYSRRLWIGGRSDFGYEDMEGKIVLGDIKSSREAYLSHFLQAGAYAMQIEEHGLFTDAGKSILGPLTVDYFAIFPFGGGFKEPSIRKDTFNFKQGFESALGLYRIKKLFEGE